MNKIIKICFVCFVLFLIFFPVVKSAEYKLLAPLPGGTAAVPADSQGFTTYMSQLFWFLLSAATILALVMLVVGGVEYIGSAGNVSILGDAKNRIINALAGLVLALAAWLILNTINPDLVDFSLPIKPIGTAANTTQKSNTPPLDDNN